MTYATDPNLLDCVEAIVGPEILFVNSMVITKPPGVDARHPLHQDLLYVHGSGTNRTEGFRRAISVHYAQADAHDEWNGEDRLAKRPWIPVRGSAVAAP
jgi:hypothetical protein